MNRTLLSKIDEQLLGAPIWFAQVCRTGIHVKKIVLSGSEDLSKVLALGEPAIIKGIELFDPSITWSADTLSKRIGSKILRVECYDENDWFKPARYVKMTVDDFLFRSANDSAKKYYLADVSIGDSLQELSDDFLFPSIIDKPRVPLRTLYVGTNTVSPTHFHSRTHVLNFPVTGDRFFALYPPNQSHLIYREPWHSPFYYFSRLPLDRVNLLEYPLLTRAQPFVCKLQPGESLYIPPHWWHFVSCPSFGIAVTCAWRANWKHWHMNYPSFISFLRLYLTPRFLWSKS